MAEEYVVGTGVVYKDEPKKVEAKEPEGDTQKEEVKPEPKAEKQDDAHTARAKASGWTDKEAWVEAGHDPDDWRDARTYNDRGELLKKISSQSAELRKVQEAVASLSEHNKQVYVAGYKKAINDLKVQRAQAIENNDGKALLQIEDAMDQQKEALQKVESTPVAQPVTTVTPAFQDFKDANDWYDKQPALKKWAHGEAIDFAKENPRASEQAVYDHIAKAVRTEFPEKFQKKNSPPPALDGEGRSSTAGRAATTKGSTQAFEKLMDRLPEDQARVARDLVKRKYITAEKYVEDYESIGQGR